MTEEDLQQWIRTIKKREMSVGVVQGRRPFLKKLEYFQNEIAWITLRAKSARATQVTNGATHAVHERKND